MPKDDIYYIEVVGKALNVLDAFAQLPKRQLSLQEISKQLRLNKNAVFRILYSLAEHGYIIKENRQYQLGPKLMELSNARLQHTDLLSVAGPLMSSLLDRFGETVNLGVMDTDRIRYIGVWESRERFRLAEKVGATDMLHSSALGKAYLSHIPFDEVRRLVRATGLPAQTPHTIASLRALRTELETSRERGYAMDNQEGSLGARCIGCAILEATTARPLAVVSVSGPIVRLTDDRVPQIAQALMKATAEINWQLGGRSPDSVRKPKRRHSAKHRLSSPARRRHRTERRRPADRDRR